MEHTEPLPGCVIEHKEFKKHLEDSPVMRDKVIRHDEQIITLIKTVTDQKETIESIFNRIDSSAKETQSMIIKGILSVIVSVVIAIIYTGRYIEKIERLDKIHQDKVEVQK